MKDLLFAAAIGQTLLIALIFALSPERKQKHFAYLILVLLAFAGAFSVILAKNYIGDTWMNYWELVFGLALGPLIWLHVETITGKRPGPFTRDLVWFSPVILGLLLVFGVPIPVDVVRILMLVAVIAAVLYSLVRVSTYIRWYDDSQSQSGPQRLGWLLSAHYIVGTIVILSILQHLAERADPDGLGFAVMVLIAVGLVFLNVFIAVNLLSVASVQSSDIQRQASSPPSHLNEKDLQAAQNKLEQAMTQQELFRDPGLQLHTLSEATGLTEGSITEAIRRGLANNFFDYVNGHRIKSAQTKLAKTEMSITEVMFASGFNSKSSFYSEFSKRLGKTPSQYRSQA